MTPDWRYLGVAIAAVLATAALAVGLELALTTVGVSTGTSGVLLGFLGMLTVLAYTSATTDAPTSVADAAVEPLHVPSDMAALGDRGFPVRAAMLFVGLGLVIAGFVGVGLAW